MSRLKILPLLILAVGSMRAAELVEEIEFSGVLVAADHTTVHLTKKSTGFSAWTALGQPFAEYTVTSYDPGTETLVLLRDGVPLRVQLNAGQKNPETPAAITIPQKIAIMENLRKLSAALDQHFLETGKTRALLSDLVGTEKSLRQLEPVYGEDYTQLELMQGSSTFAVTTRDGNAVTYQRNEPAGKPAPPMVKE